MTVTKVAHLPPGARGIRLDDKPTVSVVVASCRDPELLAACLASLEQQCSQHRAEIVVARAVECGEPERLAERYPDVRWVTADPQTDMPQLRGLGLAAAQGDIVALTEDHCVAGPNWLSQLLQGSGPASDVVRGAIDNGAGDGIVERARSDA